jgi:hypothetical protein
MSWHSRSLCAAAWLAACSPNTDIDSASERLQAELAESRTKWDALSAANGASYSYTEENCRGNAPTATVTEVQVNAGKAQIVSTTEIPTSECLAQVNRYNDFTAQTLPQLYEQCLRLVQSEGAEVELEFDDRGLIRGCTWPGDETCVDNCGEGFYLRSLAF